MKLLRTISAFTWELPQTLVALGIIAFHAVRGTKVEKKETVLRYGELAVYEYGDLEDFGGYAFGKVLFVNPKILADRKARILAHQTGFSALSLYFGPLFLLAVTLPALVVAALYDAAIKAKKTTSKLVVNYHDFYPSNLADVLGNVTRK